MRRVPALVPLTLGAMLAVAGCSSEPFQAPRAFQGVVVDAATLNLGYRTYQAYCRACHGRNGDGRGPASEGLRPPPRDFRRGVFKFARVEVGSLPTDEDLRRTILGGLAGTAMRPWDLDDLQLHAVVQYIKSFSPVWQDGNTRVGTPIPVAPDPWAGRADQAAAVGRRLYHGLAQCNACHPSYVPYQEIVRARLEYTGRVPDDLGPAIYGARDHPDQYLDLRMRVPPPDFLRQPMRAARDPEQLYLTIAAGIGGTAMPTWEGSLSTEQLWALTHYVHSLLDLRGTPAAEQLQRDLASQLPPAYPSNPLPTG